MVRHEDAVAARSAIFGSPNKRNTILYSQFLKLVACLKERMMFVDLNFCLHSKF